MRPTQHPSNNAVLGAPEGWQQGDTPCRAIPITRMEADGLPMVATFWEFTAEERAAIASGALLQVTVVGTTMPPIAIEPTA